MHISVFTDGCCFGNQSSPSARKAGIGVFVPDHEIYNISMPVTRAMLRMYDLDHPTNQNAELLAVLFALKICDRMPDVQSVTILSDSMYAINACTTWLPGWKRRGWRKSDGTTIQNKSIIRHISDILDGCGHRQTSFEHVKAHQHPPLKHESHAYFRWRGNFNADELARRGAS
jgi:ribonuclease HI